MTDAHTEKSEKNEMVKSEYIKYIAGGIVAIIVLGAVWVLKSQVMTEPPVTALKCDSGFFNYVVGKSDILVQAAGVDSKDSTSVTCQFNYTDPNGTPSANTVNGQLTDIQKGKSWRCVEQPKTFPKGTTKFSVTATNSKGETSTCNSQIFLQ